MSKCNYHKLPDGRWTCIRCLRTTKSTPARAPNGTCSARGLGDYIKSALDALGLTTKRWAAIRRSFGLKSKKCGCRKRQEKINRWADWFRAIFFRTGPSTNLLNSKDKEN